MKWTNMDLPARKGGAGGGLNNSHSSPHSPPHPLCEQSQHAASIRLDSKAPWQPLGSRGHGERLLLSANEVGTWGSVSLHLCFTTIDAERRIIYQCLPSDTVLSYLNPGWMARLPGERGLAHISFCPVGKITNGSEIAVSPPGSSLSNKCSHANPQSAHKPEGWCSPSLRLESDTSAV